MTAKSFDKETDSMNSPALSSRRAGQLVCVIAALAFAALVVTPSAGAATLYACVNKRTGAARLFSYKPRCKRGQERLSWNTEGPAGKNGTNGKNGATGKTGPTGKTGNPGSSGTNGAVKGYSESKAGYTEFTKKEEATILTKSLPAGNYIVSAKTVLSSSASAVVRVAAVCDLLDGGPGSVVDTSGWDAALVEELPGGFIGETTLSFEAAVSLSATASVSLVCTDRSPDKEGQKIGAASSQIVAVQTSQNG
jgi:hypothetical protein